MPYFAKTNDGLALAAIKAVELSIQHYPLVNIAAEWSLIWRSGRCGEAPTIRLRMDSAETKLPGQVICSEIPPIASRTPCLGPWLRAITSFRMEEILPRPLSSELEPIQPRPISVKGAREGRRNWSDVLLRAIVSTYTAGQMKELLDAAYLGTPATQRKSRCVGHSPSFPAALLILFVAPTRARLVAPDLLAESGRFP